MLSLKRAGGLIAIAGGMVLVAVLLVAISIVFLWPGPRSAPSPPTSLPFPTPTPFVLPPNSAAWSDTAQRIVLVYPTAWKKALPSDSTLRLTARDGTTFLLYDTNFNRSAADGILAIQQAHAAETASGYDADLATRNYTDGPVRDAQIGGEPAKMMPYLSVSKQMPTEAAHRGEIWTVAHAGSQYTIQIEYGADGNADVAGILASLRFIAPVAFAVLRA